MWASKQQAAPASRISLMVNKLGRLGVTEGGGGGARQLLLSVSFRKSLLALAERDVTAMADAFLDSSCADMNSDLSDRTAELSCQL